MHPGKRLKLHSECMMARKGRGQFSASTQTRKKLYSLSIQDHGCDINNNVTETEQQGCVCDVFVIPLKILISYFHIFLNKNTHSPTVRKLFRNVSQLRQNSVLTTSLSQELYCLMLQAHTAAQSVLHDQGIFLAQ